MKNREVRVLIATMMLVSMVAGSLFTVPAAAFAGENAAVQENVTKEKGQAEVVKDDTAEEKAAKDAPSKTQQTASPRKDETVYAKIDGNGAVKSVTVSDQLKNLSGITKLNDASILNEIENVKGDETFSGNAGTMVWNTADADICYQGTTDKALPVSVKISYQLDGKSVSAEELEGKSGHLIIRYTYVNESADTEAEKIPFLMATGLLLDEVHFKNVAVTNGRVVSDGERNVAVGYGFPGLKEILGVEEVEIPDYFEVEADVTEYESARGITIASNSVFNELDVDGIDSLSDLEASMHQLQDASNQLVEGSGELKDGLDTLLKASGTLTDGVEQLADGGDTLLAGTQALTEGSTQLTSGNAALAEGTGLLKSGADSLKVGAGQLDAGLVSAAEQTRKVLLPGVQTLDAGVAQMQNSLGAQLPTLKNGVSSLNGGIMQVGDGIAALNSGISQAADGAAALSSGVSRAADGAAALDGGVSRAADGAALLSSGMSAAGDGMSNLNSGIQQVAGQTGNLSAAAEAVYQGLLAAQGISGPSAEVQPDSWAEVETLRALAATVEDTDTQAQLYALADTLAAEQSTRDASAAASTGTDLSALTQLAGVVASGTAQVDAAMNIGVNGGLSLSAGAAALNTAMNVQGPDGGASLRVGAAGLDAAMNTGVNGSASIRAGAAALDAAMNSGDAANGVSSIRDGAAALDAALNNGDAANGVSSIRAGAAALDAAMNSGDAANGVSGIRAGAAALEQGISGENGLAAQLTAGVSRVKDGTSALAAGVGGEKGLSAGLNQLSGGAASLSAGASQLSEKLGEAASGAKTAASGAASLKVGAKALLDGTKALSTGIHTLKDGSGELTDGVKKLDEGAGQLEDGMIQFDEEGIQKLASVFDGDIEGMIDKMNTMLDKSKAYKNFSGIADDMDGEVKFIFMTE